MRLFTAVNFTPEVKDELMRAVSALKAASVSGGFTARENLHLTLAFIGETEEEDRARDALESVRFGAFELELSALGHFGDIQWAGVRENEKLKKLAADVQSALRGQGFDIEKRGFSPHITLGRRVRLRDGAMLYEPKAKMTVKSISLMKSERVNGRLVYTEIFKREAEK